MIRLWQALATQVQVSFARVLSLRLIVREFYATLLVRRVSANLLLIGFQDGLQIEVVGILPD